MVFKKKKHSSKLVEDIQKREKQINGCDESFNQEFRFNTFFLFLFFSVSVFILIYSVFKLQILEGEKMYARSTGNQINLVNLPPRRGIVFDRNGVKLVENRSVVDCYILMKKYLNDDGSIKDELLKEDVVKIEGILGESWIRDVEGEDFNSILERIYIILEAGSSLGKIKIASDIDNDTVIAIKSVQEEIPSVFLEEGISRYYPYGEYLTHVLGYTSIVNAADLENIDYVSFNDIVGRTGIERYYDSVLFGEKGQLAIEVDAFGKPVSGKELLVKEPVPGKSLYLSLDLEAQKKSYEILKNGVEKFEASSGTMILQDVKTGEILVMSSFPSYDNNLFVGGISQEDFDELLNATGNPLTNKAIGAQVPPGSIFKPIVAASALDAGAVTKDTVYVSRRGYTFTGGQPFQEYNNNEYGRLNMLDALMLSSNIYFCEIIRNWDMQKLVPYLEDFGIGKYTGIDILGEGPGRLPSPENKVALAKTTSPWLEPFWLPEGDSCNSVIGQGITTVTPIQAVNWTSAIANGGILHTPHLGVRADGEGFEFEKQNEAFVSEKALEIVREGMRASVSGHRRVIVSLTDAKVDVGAKTGTAEFGKLNLDGRYEHTHAWVTGFFPYDTPEYAFVVFLEDGGQSNNSAEIAREFIDWFVDEEAN